MGALEVLRKHGLIFWELVIFFFLAIQAGSGEPVVAAPSSSGFTIVRGGVATWGLEVLHLDPFSFSGKSHVDGGWRLFFSSEFKTPPGKAKRILALLPIPEREAPQGEEEIETGDESTYRAWIALEYHRSHLKVRAFCFNNTPEDEVLQYKLKAKKRGPRGTVSTSQSGSVYIPSRKKKCLSQLILGVSPKDCYEIKLQVYKDGKLVAEDSVCYPQSPPLTGNCLSLVTRENHMNL